jgi:predicted membrane GTPase involved in stress response
MANMVIAVYRPREGRQSQLLELVREHVPALRRLGLATARPPVVLRAKDGSLLELFEWVSAEAVEQAHHHPEVQKLWARFEEVCEWTPLGALEEAKVPFSHFDLVELKK